MNIDLTLQSEAAAKRMVALADSFIAEQDDFYLDYGYLLLSAAYIIHHDGIEKSEVLCDMLDSILYEEFKLDHGPYSKEAEEYFDFIRKAEIPEIK